MTHARAALALLAASLAGGANGCAGERSAGRGEAYFIVDADAAGGEAGALGGALFRFERATGETRLFCADPRFVDPQLALTAEDGDLLLVDFAAEPDGRGRAGAVFRIDGRSGQVKACFTPQGFAAPTGLALGVGGEVYVTDRRARPPGAQGQGALFALCLADGSCRVVATDARFVAPAFVLRQEDASLLLLDADVPGKKPGEEGAVFRVDPSRGAVSECGRLAGAVSPLGLLAEPEGTFLVFDANADPRGAGAPHGAILRFDPDSGATEVVACDPLFRDPVRGCVADDGLVLFVDANADPEGRGPDPAGRGQNATGGGAIFSLDRVSGAVRVVAAPAAFVNPVCIVRAP